MNFTANTTDLLLACPKDFSLTFIKEFLSLFYLIPIQESIKDDPTEVPNYEILLIITVSFLVAVEQIIRFFQRKELSRFEDCVVNVGSSFIFGLTRAFLFVVVVRLFSFIYDNYRIVDLPLHSVSTWFFSLLLVEFVYYWTHRALHEFNILWAAHQFHHMAEDINITTTIRDSIVDLVIYDIFPIPLALIVPPQILSIHIQFSLIYQIWLHNEVIGRLGPLEYIINTPRQHRVHHGKNPYCIDKNYGALLMIWDRMFGTYQEEKESSKIVFGCVSPTPKTFDSMTLQFGYYRDLIRKFKSVDGFGNKMSALFKGPGWSPNKPRLGLLSDIPEPDPNAPKYTYTPYISLWKKVYIFLHSIVFISGFYLIADHPVIKFDPIKVLACLMYVIFSLTSFGAIFDSRLFMEVLEIARCVTYFVFDYYILQSSNWPIEHKMQNILSASLMLVRIVHGASIVFWMILLLNKLCNSGLESSRSNKSNIITNVLSNNSDDKLSISKKPLSVADFEINQNAKPQLSKKSLITGLILFVFSFFVYSLVYAFSIPSCVQLVNILF